MCGRKKMKEHTPDALANIGQGKWRVTDPACIDIIPTTAYGEIEFPNANIAKVYDCFFHGKIHFHHSAIELLYTSNHILVNNYITLYLSTASVILPIFSFILSLFEWLMTQIWMI